MIVIFGLIKSWNIFSNSFNIMYIKGCAYVVGGHGTFGQAPSTELLKLDLKTLEFVELSKMRFTRHYLTVAMMNGSLYAVGGTIQVHLIITEIYTINIGGVVFILVK